MSDNRYQPVPTNGIDDDLEQSRVEDLGEKPRMSSSLLLYHDDRMETFIGTFLPYNMPGGISELLTSISIVFSILKYFVLKHTSHVVGIVLSFLLCVICGAVHTQLVDASFFKAVGLLLAVLLSLRAKNALSRRSKLMVGVLEMMNSAKNLLYLMSLDKDNWRRLRGLLQFCFEEVADWATQDMVPATERYNVDRMKLLDPCDREAAFILRSKVTAGISPRPLLLFLRDFCDDLFDPEASGRLHDNRTSSARCPLSSSSDNKVDKISVIRRFHRNLELELHSLFSKFDLLVMYREQFLTVQFRWMLETVILLYVALYPWCVRDESSILLGATTAGMGFVFYGLNALTEQIEDPVSQRAQAFDLHSSFQKMFEELDVDEKVRIRCRDFLRTQDVSTEINEELHQRFEASLAMH